MRHLLILGLLSLVGCRRESRLPADDGRPAASPIRGFAPMLAAPAEDGGTTSTAGPGASVALPKEPASPEDAAIEKAVGELRTILLQLPEKRLMDDGAAPARVAFFPQDGSASECRFDDQSCALQFEGLFIGGGSSGGWRTFRKRDLGRGPLEVADSVTTEWIPYEQWRRGERVWTPGSADVRGGPKAQLPVRVPGNGVFGYGQPTHQVRGAALRHPTVAVLGAAGFVVKQVDYFATEHTRPGERGPYPVFTVGWPPGEAIDARIVVAIASRLVAANGGYPLEIAVSPDGARFQADHLRSQAYDTANVYALGPLGFDPVGMWLKPKG